MDLKIFDVEHGACALLTCDDNTTLMLDAGHNGSTSWRPGDYLRANNINRLDMLAITNYDEDHVSGIANLFDTVDVRWLWRNKSVDTTTLARLKSDAGMGAGITRLCHAIDRVFTGNGSATKPAFSGLKRSSFHCDYPEFDDENNLSMATFLVCHGVGVLFTGDLERRGWESLSRNPDFRDVMAQTRVLIAPHHGRIPEADRPWFTDFYKSHFGSVNYVVISDKGYQYNTQNTIPVFRAFAKGGPFRGENRSVLTTRKDGRIGFQFRPDGWSTY